MKIGIMQPYFVPYIGYWQLMNAVDQYVIYDDVNYINRGWINRNRILFEGKPMYFNISILKASQNKKINEIFINPDAKLRNKNLRTLETAYKKAPQFGNVYPMLAEILNNTEEKLSVFLAYSIRKIAAYLDIKTEFIMSSDIQKDNTKKGQDKILEICEKLHATEYYNAIGGINIYDFAQFTEKDIQLHFLKTQEITYKQFGNEFIANLSIIDVLMFNTQEDIKKMLELYHLINKKGEE